jgi:Na+/proline symporter
MWTDTVQVIIMFISMAVVGFLIHLLKWSIRMSYR